MLPVYLAFTKVRNNTEFLYLLYLFCFSEFFKDYLLYLRIFYIFAKTNAIMRVVSQRKLKEYFETPGNGEAKVPLERWFDIAENASWKNFADIRSDFPSADFVGNQHYVFNISGNKFRLVVVVKFVMGYIFIRWVGRHKDYENIDCKNI